MTGCGFNLGTDTKFVKVYDNYDGKGKGNYVRIEGPGASAFPDDVGTGLVKRPFLVYGAASGLKLSEYFKEASVKIPIEHMIGHIALNVSGGMITDCGIYECFAKNIKVSFDPFSIASTALSIGEGIGNSVSGFSEGLAAGLMVAIWFGNFMNMIIHERFTMDAVLKGCMLLFVGMFVVYNSTEFASLFIHLLYKPVSLTLNNGFLTAAKAAFKDITASYASVGFNIPVAMWGIPVGYVFMDDIGVSVAIAIGSIMVLGAQIACAMSVISALVPVGIEIGLRIQLAPLVFAMSSQTGWTPQTIGYLKGCIAAGAAPALIVAVISAGPKIIEGFGGGAAAGGGATDLLMAAIIYTVTYKALGGFVGNANSLMHQILH